jgi:trimeric autotransporter adhesin
MPARLVVVLLLLCVLPSSATGATGARLDRGSAVVIDSASGREVARVSANGALVTAVADGRGGWFVGGSFTRIGGQSRVAVAHLLRSGVVDPAWRSSIGSASGRAVAVDALARAGSRLFVAGSFGRVGGLRRPGLAALDAQTGAVLPGWAPRPRAWPDVATMAVVGGRLLVARNYNYPVPGVTALRISTATVDRGWNSHLRLIGDAGSFNTLLPFRGRVFVAGSFRVAALSRSGLVALSADNGSVDRHWAPQVQNCRVCIGFALLYGLAATKRLIYVSGAFGRVDGVARDGIAALDTRSGAVERSWRPAQGGSDVLHLALTGSRLYLGGLAGLSALDAQTGTVVRLPPNHAPVQVLALITSGRGLLAAGRG